MDPERAWIIAVASGESRLGLRGAAAACVGLCEIDVLALQLDRRVDAPETELEQRKPLPFGLVVGTDECPGVLDVAAAVGLVPALGVHQGESQQACSHEVMRLLLGPELDRLQEGGIGRRPVSERLLEPGLPKKGGRQRTWTPCSRAQAIAATEAARPRSCAPSPCDAIPASET